MNTLSQGWRSTAQDFLSARPLGQTSVARSSSQILGGYGSLHISRDTTEMIGRRHGINQWLEIVNEKYDDNLEGGIMESFAVLFRNGGQVVRLPMREQATRWYMVDAMRPARQAPSLASNVSLITEKNVRIATIFTFTPTFSMLAHRMHIFWFRYEHPSTYSRGLC